MRDGLVKDEDTEDGIPDLGRSPERLCSSKVHPMIARRRMNIFEEGILSEDFEDIPLQHDIRRRVWKGGQLKHW